MLPTEIADIFRAEFYLQFDNSQKNCGKSREGGMMKTSTTIRTILSLTVAMLIAGCSRTQNQVSILWEERQMDDDRRLYGNPYDSLNRREDIFSFTPLVESCLAMLSQDAWGEGLLKRSAPSDSAAEIPGGVNIESQNSLNWQVFSFAPPSAGSPAFAVK
jgi:hypothetical protein